MNGFRLPALWGDKCTMCCSLSSNFLPTVLSPLFSDLSFFSVRSWSFVFYFHFHCVDLCDCPILFAEYSYSSCRHGNMQCGQNSKSGLILWRLRMTTLPTMTNVPHKIASACSSVVWMLLTYNWLLISGYGNDRQAALGKCRWQCFPVCEMTRLVQYSLWWHVSDQDNKRLAVPSLTSPPESAGRLWQ